MLSGRRNRTRQRYEMADSASRKQVSPEEEWATYQSGAEKATVLVKATRSASRGRYFPAQKPNPRRILSLWSWFVLMDLPRNLHHIGQSRPLRSKELSRCGPNRHRSSDSSHGSKAGRILDCW